MTTEMRAVMGLAHPFSIFLTLTLFWVMSWDKPATLKFILFVWARTEPTEGPCEGLGPKVTLTPPSLQVHVICPLRRGASVWDVVIWVQLIGQAVSH